MNKYTVIMTCMSAAIILAVGVPPILFTMNIPDRERVQVSTVQDISTVKYLLKSDRTTLTLGNGSAVKLYGKFDGWKPGEAVTKPVIKKGDDADSDSQIRELKQVWCVGDKCLHEDHSWG